MDKSTQDRRGAYGRANSIEAQGLEHHVHKLYLAGEVKKDYPYLEEQMADGQNGQAIVKAFGIDHKTATKWRTAFNKEHKRGNSSRDELPNTKTETKTEAA